MFNVKEVVWVAAGVDATQTLKHVGYVLKETEDCITLSLSHLTKNLTIPKISILKITDIISDEPLDDVWLMDKGFMFYSGYKALSIGGLTLKIHHTGEVTVNDVEIRAKVDTTQQAVDLLKVIFGD